MTTTLDIVRAIIGRRSRIDTTEMWRILVALGEQGLDLANPYVRGTEARVPDAAQRWVDACRGITVISVDRRGLRDGYVRYDQPGSIHPQQRAEVAFVSSEMGPESLASIRRRAQRVLIVRRAPDEPVAQPQPRSQPRYTLGCDNGHIWTTDDSERDAPGYAQCPVCGEYWV